MFKNFKPIIATIFLTMSMIIYYAAGMSESVYVPGGSTHNSSSLFSSYYPYDLMTLKKQVPQPETFSSMNKGDLYHAGHGRRDDALMMVKSSKMRRGALNALYRKHGFNDEVKWRMEEFSRDRHNVRTLLYRSGRYVETMSSIFAEEGLPRELAYLPMIESGFRTHAHSHENAVGPWQFVPSTARRMGLKIDWWVDERRDPVKSTKAASQYLKYLHKRFGSWNLALAAYNAGEGKISNALIMAGASDFWTISNTSFIASETKNYIPSYIAAAAIAIDPENFGISDITYESPFKYDEVEIQEPMSLEAVSGFAGADVSLIKELNPELRRSSTPQNVSRYTLRIPAGTREMFLANLSGTKEEEARYSKSYEARNGHIVAKIVQTIVAAIQKIIDIDDPGKKAVIVAGGKILVPHQGKWDNKASMDSYI